MEASEIPFNQAPNPVWSLEVRRDKEVEWSRLLVLQLLRAPSPEQWVSPSEPTELISDYGW
jgi:hypothetical protein